MPDLGDGALAEEAQARSSDSLPTPAATNGVLRNTPSTLRQDYPPGCPVRTDVSALGGLQHRALVTGRPFPTARQLLEALPSECYVRSLWRSLGYASVSVVLTLVLGGLGYVLAARWPASLPSWSLPLQLLMWTVYAAVTGTVATGVWVCAHECGHGAFCESVVVQDTIGWVLHSLLLVPYFSWQRSHAVHHSRTNHLDEGETHVPHSAYAAAGQSNLWMHRMLGTDAFGVLNVLAHLLSGWPAYLLYGATGGPVRGLTNHFVPLSMGRAARQSTGEHLNAPMSLFPGRRWKLKVLLSDVGVLLVLAALVAWARTDGWRTMLLVYGGPYLVTNMWLVLYTWLQHTDVDVPHYGSEHWTWAKGALLTVDRPYPPLIDWLHHRIGSTHVAHHVCSRIPHYRARLATIALRKAFPEYYLYDPTPIYRALWRVASRCVVVAPVGDLWVYTASGERWVTVGSDERKLV
ncbi:hypothetical protein CDCA_CDCA16G4286 [Cyanidium caldarium]|uniref:Fatty acid desaturase domain-containing protein n=1 Tax=Cyanidium caldarium TaxID=2771 RepID=A0AAV9J1H5_CYACA|nr:hypothetical protein CDCA_CDCA16G4286 [Cyanidium caldarium]